MTYDPAKPNAPAVGAAGTKALAELARKSMTDADHAKINDPTLRRIPPWNRAEAKRRIKMAKEEIEAMQSFLGAHQ